MVDPKLQIYFLAIDLLNSNPIINIINIMLSRPNCFTFRFRYTYQTMHVFFVYKGEKEWRSNMENEGESNVCIESIKRNRRSG